MVYRSSSLQDTLDIAREVLGKLQGRQEAGKINTLALRGELGSGKTTFVQAVGKALGVKERITSPTFVLMRSFKVPLTTVSFDSGAAPFLAKTGQPQKLHPRFCRLYHFDLYRLRNWQEVAFLGIEEIWQDPRNLVCIEWAEKIRERLPVPHLQLKFDYLDENSREIDIDIVSSNLKSQSAKLVKG